MFNPFVQFVLYGYKLSICVDILLMAFGFNFTTSDLIQMVLIFVLIVQASYLHKQTTVLRRTSQANIVESWFKKQPLTMESMMVLYDHMDEVKFQKLINMLYDAHSYFMRKLLNPLDLAQYFNILNFVIIKHKIYDTQIYYENYLKLQEIYGDYSHDIDSIMAIISNIQTSELEKAFINIRFKNSLKICLKYWNFLKFIIRLVAWIDVKLLRRKFFNLPTPVELKS